jgi:hypothetical protein
MFAATLCLMLAAPVPAAGNKELDGAWADMLKPEPEGTRAVLKFAARPKDAIPYFKEKLPPLKLTAEQLQPLLVDLGSEKEDVWKAAVEKLDYFDARLAVDLEKLMALPEVQDLTPRARLVAILSGERKADGMIKTGKPIVLNKHGAANEEPYYNFFQEGSWWAEAKIEKLNIGSWGNRRPAWTRAVRAIALLEFYNTADANAVLARLAEGHPDAQPTRVAKAALKK